MDKSEVKNWVDENIHEYKRMFGITHWHLKVYYEVMEDQLGNCEFHPQYEEAVIKLNHEAIEDIEELEKLFVHELGHIVHPPFRFYVDVVNQLLTDEQYKAMDRLYDHVQELVVKNIERMHWGHASK